MNPIANLLNRNSMNAINQMSGLLNGKNPSDIMNNMLRTNPQFRQFVDENRGLTTEQIAQKYGVDMNLVNKFANFK